MYPLVQQGLPNKAFEISSKGLAAICMVPARFLVSQRRPTLGGFLGSIQAALVLLLAWLLFRVDLD